MGRVIHTRGLEDIVTSHVDPTWAMSRADHNPHQSEEDRATNTMEGPLILSERPDDSIESENSGDRVASTTMPTFIRQG